MNHLQWKDVPASYQTSTSLPISRSLGSYNELVHYTFRNEYASLIYVIYDFGLKSYLFRHHSTWLLGIGIVTLWGRTSCPLKRIVIKTKIYILDVFMEFVIGTLCLEYQIWIETIDVQGLELENWLSFQEMTENGFFSPVIGSQNRFQTHCRTEIWADSLKKKHVGKCWCSN